jgi:hypothetical protein
MILPTTPIQVIQKSPRRLFIFSQPKVGKTALVADLPNALLVDMEDGSEFIKAAKINVIKYAIENKISRLKVLKEISNSLAKREHVYDYIILDTATSMEDMAATLAVINYKQSPMGKNFIGNDVLTLPNGAGYLWLRNAFEEIYQLFDSHAAKAIILLGHVKNASINKDGKELNARDIHLTGKLKQIVTSNMDAIGFLYRDKETGKNMLSFNTNEQDLATGARPEHLRGKEFAISEMIDGNLVTHWDKIFID